MQSMRFEAMGTSAHVIVLGGSERLLQTARHRIAELESRWSRFRPDSELSRLNNARGRPVRVSHDTFRAVTAAIDAWRDLDCVFDPTVLDALEHAGYDRTFADIPAIGRALTAPAPPVPGCDGIQLDPIVRAVCLPLNVRVDLGGIGKGLAADMVADELRAAGADGAMVNIGGDLKVAGSCPQPNGWTIELDHLPGRAIALVAGGLATSAITKRRWRRGAEIVHHVIDPATGAAAAASAAAATVIADRAVDAETLATAALLAGTEAGVALLEARNATGILIGRDGTRHATTNLLALVA